MSTTDSPKASAPPGCATAYVGTIRPGTATAASIAPTAPSQLPTMFPRCAWMEPRRALTTPRVTVTSVTTDSTCSQLKAPSLMSRIQNEVIAVHSMRTTQARPRRRWRRSPFGRRHTW